MKRRYNTRSSSKSKNGDQENNTEQLPSDQENNLEKLPSDQENKLEKLPSDLVVDILTKLPIKSIAKVRCVSKLHASTIRGPNFTESFFTISSSRPKLLFTCLKDGETFVFSSPQPQNPSPVTPSFHMKFSINCHRKMPRPVHGFVCGLNQQKLIGRTDTNPMICNPSTGQSLTLPRVRTRRMLVSSYLGYDPIDKQFKILAMTHSGGTNPYTEEHQVLTLETGTKPKWRMIKCDIPHYPLYVDCRNDGICINGVIYYLAWTGNGFPDLVCFDITSEKFHLIKKAQGMRLNNGSSIIDSSLVNYKGGLATLQPITAQGLMHAGVELWVLEDAQKHQWSRHTYVLPPPWKDIIAKTKLCLVGTTSRGEIVMSPNIISDSFYLLYYNPETNAMTTVDIQGLEAFKAHKACIFLDHVENVKLLADV